MADQLNPHGGEQTGGEQTGRLKVAPGRRGWFGWRSGAAGVAAFGVIGVLALIGSHVPRAVGQQPDLSISDPQVLYESAERVTSAQLLILAEYLDAPSYGHAMRPTEDVVWYYTGLLMPIGAQLGANAIGNGNEAVPDGIYWVVSEGTLFSEDSGPEPGPSHAFDFVAGELIVIGEGMASTPNNKCRVGGCLPGYYACCYQETTGQQRLVCKCVSNNSSPSLCRTGGPGTTSCELWKRDFGGACEVKCDRDNGYRACCYISPDPNDPRPVCRCYHQNDPPPAECDNGVSTECYQPNPSEIHINPVEPPAIEEGP